MPLEKVLHKIQDQIHELAPLLETFVDPAVQPSVSDSEQLQRQLSLLQESIAVYKYQKLEKEISPSFNLHARISAQEKPVERTEAPAQQVQKVVEEVKPVDTKREEPKREEPKYEAPKREEPKREEPKQEEPKVTPSAKAYMPHRKAPLVIGLNDKFRFINTLFSQSSSEYGAAVEQLASLQSWSETEIYLNSLRSVYDWKENSEVVKQFYAIAKKQFG